MPKQNKLQLEKYSSDLTISEAMKVLNVSRQTIYDLMKDGTLPFYTVKTLRRIPHEAVNRLRAKILNEACTRTMKATLGDGAGARKNVR